MFSESLMKEMEDLVLSYRKINISTSMLNHIAANNNVIAYRQLLNQFVKRLTKSSNFEVVVIINYLRYIQEIPLYGEDSWHSVGNMLYYQTAHQNIFFENITNVVNYFDIERGKDNLYFVTNMTDCNKQHMMMNLGLDYWIAKFNNRDDAMLFRLRY